MPPRKPAPQPPIVTRELPRICPACASADVARINNFGLWTLRCQADGCGWSERYSVKRETQ